ncbi:esterase/lipase family protein [Butyrivibrio sp. XPD2002]|uniref:esterase/lipase family protein n=1 Tax=Butyrivibrio sp. XPD2002 TaxID=1280665 RepID=UPI00040210CB|nr:hypothetical protein [Butyrivibrio sp. XPD2002]
MKKVYRVFAAAVSVIFPCLGILIPRSLQSVVLYLIFGALFILINIVPSLEADSLRTRKLRQCLKGAELLRFYMVASVINAVIWVADLVVHIMSVTYGFWVPWLLSALMIFLTMSILYWNGCIRIITNSSQAGIVNKAASYFFAWFLPFIFAIVPGMIKRAENEAYFENYKIGVNEQRHAQQICRTRYPLLMVHGVFFRDFKPAFLNYWGRISGELQLNGATVFYGNQQSAASVDKCGAELAERIKQIVAETGCEKVNIIAHSKGGLDSRAAIARYGVEDMVASLTTVNTPHRGCEFADYLLSKIGQPIKDKVAATYNAALSKLGDPNPNFIEAVTDLTHEACEKFNSITPDSDKVYYQSIGSYMASATGGRFPLNFSYNLVRYFDGRNDGLVGEKSFPWGQNYTFLEPRGGRGISHADMIDLNRENFECFDVREFYVQLVNDLRQRGF